MKLARSLSKFVGSLHLIFFGLFGGLVAADTLQFQPMRMDLEPQDRLIIRGYDGDLRVIQTPGSEITIQVKQVNPAGANSILKESQDDWLFSVERVEQGVEIKVKSPPMKSVWVEALKTKQTPRFILEVRAPARPLKVIWQRGRLQIQQWAAPLSAHLESGDLRITQGSGDLKVALQEGQLEVSQQKGSVQVESFKGQVKLDAIEGPVSLLNFSGSSTVKNNQGGLTLKGFDGKFLLTENEGSVDFELVRSPLRLLKHKGEVRGSVDQGSLSLQVLKFSELRLKTKAADVSLELPSSGASLNLGTEQGQIYAPSQFSVVRSARMKTLRGRLKGKEQGRIFVRSESGNIRLRSS